MGNIVIDRSRTLNHYKKNASFIIRDYNKKFAMPYYFSKLLPVHGRYKVADLGSGIICTLGGVWAGSVVEIIASDILQPEFKKELDRRGCIPVIPIEYQDMENLTYPDEYFDVVHCANALDHTVDVRKALNEMIRVCKTGGWVYLRHTCKQRTRFKGGHYWNATPEGFSNDEELITLDGFNTMSDGYFVISTLKKGEI